jgi:PAS domain-containing protein
MPNEELKMFILFEMTPDLVCIVSKEGFFQKINPAVSKKLGYPKKS